MKIIEPIIVYKHQTGNTFMLEYMFFFAIIQREEIINETDKMVKSKSFIGKELIQKIINVPTNLFWKVLGKIISTIPTIKNFYKSVDNNSNTSTSN